MKTLPTIVAAALLCATLASCKKNEVAPEKVESGNNLTTIDLTTMPVVRWLKPALTIANNIYTYGDTVSITGTYMNIKFKKDGTLIGEGSAQNDLGTFYWWTDDETSYNTKQVRRRDLNGNLIRLTYINKLTDFDPGAGYYPLTFKSKNPVATAVTAVSKTNANGQFSWAKITGAYEVGGTNNASVAVDNNGNIFACGTGPGASLHNEQYAYFGFIQKADTNGKLLWEKRITSQFPTSIATDNAGNCYYIGNGKIVKLTPNGVSVGEKSISDRPGTQMTTPLFLAIDSKNNLYIAGSHRTVYADGKGSWQSFVQKVDTNGNPGWYIATSSTTSGTSINITAFHVADDGDIYIACQHTGNIKVGQLNLNGADKLSLVRLSQPNY